MFRHIFQGSKTPEIYVEGEKKKINGVEVWDLEASDPTVDNFPFDFLRWVENNYRDYESIHHFHNRGEMLVRRKGKTIRVKVTEEP